MQPSVFLFAATALILAGCGSKDADVSANADTGMTAESISSNDVTAIDAVTGEAANMAADMDFGNIPANVTANSDAKPGASKPLTKSPTARTPSRAAPDKPAPAPAATEPANATE